MTYVLLALLVLSLFYFFTSYINTYSLYFVGIIWSLVIAMYSSFLLISITGNYTSIGYAFNDLDRDIFLSLIKNKIGHFDALRLFNISTASYSILISFFSVSYFKVRFSLLKKFTKILHIIFILFPIAYLIFYDPQTIYRLHCFVEQTNSPLYFNIICYIDLIMHIVTYLLLFAPALYLILQERRYLLTIYKRRQLFAVATFVFLSNILFLCVMRISSVRELYWGNTPYFMIQTRSYGAKFEKEYLIYPIIMLIAIIIMTVTSCKFNLVRTGGLLSRIHIKNRFKFLNKNMLGVFHSIKNVIYSYIIDLEDITNAKPEEQAELLNSLIIKMRNYLEHLSVLFRANDSNGDFYTENFYVSEILDELLSDTVCHDNIKIVKNYQDKAEMVYVDISYIKDAFNNILQNALEAIKEKEIDDGAITVTVFREFDLAVIEFEDNGVGLSRKMIKNIFKPFYTSKTRIENWGIGLTFVNKIIKMHNGNISIKSTVNKGTTFSVILPISEKI